MKNSLLTILVAMLAASVFADSGTRHYLLGSDYGARTSGTLDKINSSLDSSKATLVLDGAWTITNNVTLGDNIEVVIPVNGSIVVNTNKVLTFDGANINWPSNAVFSGPGTVTGTVVCILSRHDVWRGTVGNYYLTGGDLAATNDYLSTSTQFGGDVYGAYDGIQIKTGVVTTVEILDGTVTTNDMAAATLVSFSRPTSSNMFNFYASIGSGTNYSIESADFDANGADPGVVTLYNTTNLPLQAENNDGGCFTNAGPGYLYAYYRVPTNGVYEFHTYFAVKVQNDWTNTMACYQFATFADKNADGMSNNNEPDIVGLSDCEDFSSAEWVNTGMYRLKSWTASYRYHLNAGDRVMPRVVMQHVNAGTGAVKTNSVSLVGFTDSYFGFWGGLVGTR